nr:hypothetical protein [Sinorhizobium meliloti]
MPLNGNGQLADSSAISAKYPARRNVGYPNGFTLAEEIVRRTPEFKPLEDAAGYRVDPQQEAALAYHEHGSAIGVECYIMRRSADCDTLYFGHAGGCIDNRDRVNALCSNDYQSICGHFKVVGATRNVSTPDDPVRMRVNTRNRACALARDISNVRTLRNCALGT